MGRDIEVGFDVGWVGNGIARGKDGDISERQQSQGQEQGGKRNKKVIS